MNKIEKIINSEIKEYDIRSAALSAIKKLKLIDEKEIENLDKISKKNRNIFIGNLIKKNPEFYDKIYNKTVNGWLDEFLNINNIEKKYVLDQTRDSIITYSKTPENLFISKDKIYFVNKEGDFTSFFCINKIKLFFNSYTNEYKIKGHSNKSLGIFYDNYLSKYLKLIEKSNKYDLFKLFMDMRNEYFYNNDIGIYKSIFDDSPNDYSKKNNYINIIYPLFKIFENDVK